MVIQTTDERIDNHIDTMMKIIVQLNVKCGIVVPESRRLAVAIHQNMILEEALLAAHSEIPQPLEKIAIELKEIGQSEILNYMPKA